MSNTTLKPDDSSATDCLSEIDTSLPEAQWHRVNSDGTVSAVLSPELEKAFQAQENGRRLEAARLKERLSQVPLYAERAKKRGEQYWLDLAATYQGID